MTRLDGVNKGQKQKWTSATDAYTGFVEQFTSDVGKELVLAMDVLLPCSVSETSILDVGCGPGNITNVLRRHSSHARILAVDISPKMVEVLRDKAMQDVRLQVADAENLISSLGAVDGASGVYSHVLSTFMIQFANDAHLAVRGMSRVLQRQGVLGLATWGKHDLFQLCERVGRTLDSSWTMPLPYNMSWPSTDHGITTSLEGMNLQNVKVWKTKIEFVAQGEGGMIAYAFSGKNPVNETVLRSWRKNGRFLELKKAMMKTAEEEAIEHLVSEVFLAVGQKL